MVKFNDMRKAIVTLKTYLVSHVTKAEQ